MKDTSIETMTKSATAALLMVWLRSPDPLVAPCPRGNPPDTARMAQVSESMACSNRATSRGRATMSKADTSMAVIR